MNIKKKGFTLLEILIVIMIMGVLATIGTASYKSYFDRVWDTERKSVINNIGSIIITARALDHIGQYNSDENMGEFGNGSTEKERILDILSKESSYDLADVPNTGFDYYYLYKDSEDFVVLNCEKEKGRLLYNGTSASKNDIIVQQEGSANPICSKSGVNTLNFPGGYIGVNLSA